MHLYRIPEVPQDRTMPWRGHRVREAFYPGAHSFLWCDRGKKHTLHYCRMSHIRRILKKERFYDEERSILLCRIAPTPKRHFSMTTHDTR